MYNYIENHFDMDDDQDQLLHSEIFLHKEIHNGSLNAETMSLILEVPGLHVSVVFENTLQ